MSQKWGDSMDQTSSKVTDFVETLENFVASLDGAQENMTGHVTLHDSDYNDMLDNMRGPSDYQAAGDLVNGVHRIFVFTTT